MTEWLDDELSGCEFKDKRLGARFKKIVKLIAYEQDLDDLMPWAVVY